MGFLDIIKRAARKTIGRAVDWAEEKTGYDIRITEAIEEKPENAAAKQAQQQMLKKQQQAVNRWKKEEKARQEPVIIYKENGRTTGYEVVGKASVMGKPTQKTFISKKPIVAGEVHTHVSTQTKKTKEGTVEIKTITTTAKIRSDVAKKFVKYHPEFKFKRKVTPEQVKQDIESRGGLPLVDEAKAKTAMKQAAAMQKAQQIVNTGTSRYFAKTANTMFALSSKIEEGIKKKIKNKHLANVLSGAATVPTQTAGMLATIPVTTELAVKMPKETAAAAIVGAGLTAEYIAKHPVETTEKMAGAILFAKAVETAPKAVKEIKTRIALSKELKGVEGIKYNPLTGKVKVTEPKQDILFNTDKPKLTIKSVSTSSYKEGNIVYAHNMFEAKKYTPGTVKVVEYKKPIFKPTTEVVEAYKKFYGSGAKYVLKEKIQSQQPLGWKIKQIELSKTFRPLAIKKHTEVELEIAAPVRAGGKAISDIGGGFGRTYAYKISQLMKVREAQTTFTSTATKIAAGTVAPLAISTTVGSLAKRAVAQHNKMSTAITAKMFAAQKTASKMLTATKIKTTSLNKMMATAKQAQQQSVRSLTGITTATTTTTAITATQAVMQNKLSTNLLAMKTLRFHAKPINFNAPAKKKVTVPKFNLFGAAGKREYPVVAGKKAINILFGNKNIRRKRRGRK